MAPLSLSHSLWKTLEMITDSQNNWEMKANCSSLSLSLTLSLSLSLSLSLETLEMITDC